jgi:hypothetical protein
LGVSPFPTLAPITDGYAFVTVLYMINLAECVRVPLLRTYPLSITLSTKMVGWSALKR